MSASSTEGEFYSLIGYLKNDFASGNPDRVLEHASRLLELAPLYKDDWNYGNAIHFANIALGRVALSRGQVEDAVAHMLRAGETTGSPQLCTFGPNMRLAEELLRVGRASEVVEYLTRCRAFWASGASASKRWVASIRRGEVPDFGAHLEYW